MRYRKEEPPCPKDMMRRDEKMRMRQFSCNHGGERDGHFGGGGVEREGEEIEPPREKVRQ